MIETKKRDRPSPLPYPNQPSIHPYLPRHIVTPRTLPIPQQNHRRDPLQPNDRLECNNHSLSTKQSKSLYPFQVPKSPFRQVTSIPQNSKGVVAVVIINNRIGLSYMLPRSKCRACRVKPVNEKEVYSSSFPSHCFHISTLLISIWPAPSFCHVGYQTLR